jgi:hypothetical protein
MATVRVIYCIPPLRSVAVGVFAGAGILAAIVGSEAYVARAVEIIVEETAPWSTSGSPCGPGTCPPPCA